MQPNIDDQRPSTSPRFLCLVAALGASMLALGACDSDDELDELERLADSEDLEAEEAAALADPATASQPLAGDEPGPATPFLDADLDLTADPDVQAYAWQGWISEETPPSTCPGGQIVTGFDCDGGWCDNVRIECHSYGGSLGNSYWSNWISEEAPNNFHQCPGTQYMTGVACSGGWCDNLSLLCTDTSHGKSGCYWTPPYSEEQPAYMAPGGWAIAGMWCQGGWCDNKRYWVCHI